MWCRLWKVKRMCKREVKFICKSILEFPTLVAAVPFCVCPSAAASFHLHNIFGFANKRWIKHVCVRGNVYVCIFKCIIKIYADRIESENHILGLSQLRALSFSVSLSLFLFVSRFLGHDSWSWFIVESMPSIHRWKFILFFASHVDAFFFLPQIRPKNNNNKK